MNRIHTLILGVVLVAMSGGPAGAQSPVWSQLPGSPPGTSPRNDDIIFVTESLGWVARATDGIYRTTNGGLNFQRVRPSNLGLNAHFRSIGFASATRGWAGNLGPGSYDGTVTDTNVLYETFNGGDDWNPVLSVSATDIKGLCALHVLDAQHIFGGGRVRGPAHFIKSSDGGATWSVTNLTAAGVMGAIMDVRFHDPMNGFLLGMNTNSYVAGCPAPYSGRIARTTDGGVTWTTVAEAPVPCSYFWKFAWPSTNVGYASLQQNGAYNTVIFYKTTDGGANWTSNGIPLVSIGAASFFLQGIGFVSENEGWMGGSSTVAAPFNFIHTTDGGLTWSTAGYDNTRSMNKIRFLTPTFGYASGQKLHVYRVPLAITTHPADLAVPAGDTANFAVVAQGSGLLSYQWRLAGTNLPGAVASTITLANVQTANTGAYDVVVSDLSGSVTSSPATLTLLLPFQDDFDGYQTPVTVMNQGETNGYEIVFNAGSGPTDFKAIFGFDYSAVTYPTGIPPAPQSAGGSTKGLYLAINKDGTPAASVVNLYPLNQVFSGNFVLKCDLWLNWANGSFSTEHALFGINHTGGLPLRPGLSPSDGLFFALSADGGCSATSTTIRDYPAFRGRPGQSPFLMTTNDSAFGPAGLLGQRFDASDPGMTNLFPPRVIPGWATTPAGSAGLQWLQVEVRQVRDLVTWALNGTLVAQYTNRFTYTDGNVMIGYLDQFTSIGNGDSFAVFDNIRVDPLILEPIVLESPRFEGGGLAFSFASEHYAPYAVQWTTSLSASAWTTYTNLIGDGSTQDILMPLPGGSSEQQFYRVVRP